MNQTINEEICRSQVIHEDVVKEARRSMADESVLIDLADLFRVFGEVLGDDVIVDCMSCAHERRIDRHDNESFGFHLLNELFRYFQLAGEKVSIVVRHVGPVSGFPNFLEPGKLLLILDFQYVHAGEAEEF